MMLSKMRHTFPQRNRLRPFSMRHTEDLNLRELDERRTAFTEAVDSEMEDDIILRFKKISAFG